MERRYREDIRAEHPERTVRIWDIPPSKLCREHLLGEHRELHAIWSILTKGKKGYSRHPETLRWKGRLKALFLRHAKEVREMEKRGYRHKSPLSSGKAAGKGRQDLRVEAVEDQIKKLKKKKCGCLV